MSPGIPLKKVLVVEDTIKDASWASNVLSKKPGSPSFEVICVDRLSTAESRLRNGSIDAILLDLHLPDSKGLETFERLRAITKTIPVVILTAEDDEALAIQALERGAQDYLIKGRAHLYKDILERSLRFAIERRRAEEALREKRKLEETNRVMLDREQRVVELKDEVNKLLKQLGDKPRYTT